MIRKNAIISLTVMMILAVAGCTQAADANTSLAEVRTNSAAEMETDSAQADTVADGAEHLRVRLTFDNGEAVVRLEDNDAVRDFVSKLPMTQTFEDFNSIEKICRLPDEIDTEGVESGVDPAVADVTLYVPWNTLVFYYEDYGYNDSLIPMGHVESGMELLTAMGDEFQVTMELMEETEEVQTQGETQVQVQTTEITLTAGGEAIEDFQNGDVTYYPAGPSFAIFYAQEDSSSQGGLIRMGRITSDFSVFENLGDTVEVQIAVSGS